MSYPICRPCGHSHGPLYICEHYSDAKKAELQAQLDRFEQNLKDPMWIFTRLYDGRTGEPAGDQQA